MAGGQSLLPMLKLRLARPNLIVDINNIVGLDTLEESDGMLRIGALVRHRQLERSELIRDRYPMILDGAQRLADPLTRNRGTFCGSVAHGDPAGDWATIAMVLGADLHAVGPNGAVVYSAIDFQTAMFETKLGADQILIEARIPLPKPGQGSAYKKIDRKLGDYATAAVGVSIVLDGTTMTEASIGLTNVGPLTIHAADAAASLVGKSIDDAEAIERASMLAAAVSDPVSDLRGLADFKRDLVRVLTKRALRTAGARAQGTEA
jgi:carbon-monoxide dehydrogenase medium subunit